jgi:hypothetical protein
LTVQTLEADVSNLRTFNRLVRAVTLAAVGCGVACGGSAGGPSPSPATALVTESYSGRTQGTASGSCGGDSHNLSMAEGAVSVTLVQTTGGTPMTVQVCANGLDNNNCTINQTRITVGQTLTGSRKGASTQNLKLLSSACVSGGPDATVPVDYTVSITYSRIG